MTNWIATFIPSSSISIKDTTKTNALTTARNYAKQHDLRFMDLIDETTWNKGDVEV